MPWLGSRVASPIIKSAKLKPNSFKASTQEEIPRKNSFKKEEVSWKYPLVISIINDWKYLPWYQMIGSVFSWTCGQLLQITCYKQNKLVDNWTIDLVGLKLRLEKVFLSASFWRQAADEIWYGRPGYREDERRAIKKIKGTAAGWMERVRVSAKGGYCITVQFRQRQTKRRKKLIDRISAISIPLLVQAYCGNINDWKDISGGLF